MKVKPDTKIHKAIRLLINADHRARLTELEEIMYSVVTVGMALDFPL